jgi:hypothetical protein
MAALKLLHENTDEILEYARLAFAQSDLGDDDSGETVAQLMCLLAANKPSFDSVSIDGCGFGVPKSINMMNTPLHEFLTKFFGSELRPVPVWRNSQIATQPAMPMGMPSAQPVIADSVVDDAARGLAGISLQGASDSTGRVPASSSAAANLNACTDDASVNSAFSAASGLLRFFDDQCTAADIRLTHYKRVTHLPKVDELPFLFDIGAALLLPRTNIIIDCCSVVHCWNIPLFAACHSGQEYY